MAIKVIKHEANTTQRQTHRVELCFISKWCRGLFQSNLDNYYLSVIIVYYLFIYLWKNENYQVKETSTYNVQLKWHKRKSANKKLAFSANSNHVNIQALHIKLLAYSIQHAITLHTSRQRDERRRRRHIFWLLSDYFFLLRWILSLLSGFNSIYMCISFVWFFAFVNLLSLAQYWAVYVIWLMASSLHHCKYCSPEFLSLFWNLHFFLLALLLLRLFWFFCFYLLVWSFIRTCISCIYVLFIYIIPWQTVIHIRVGLLLLNGIKNNRDHTAERTARAAENYNANILFMNSCTSVYVTLQTHRHYLGRCCIGPNIQRAIAATLAGRIDDSARYRYFLFFTKTKTNSIFDYAEFHPIARNK